MWKDQARPAGSAKRVSGPHLDQDLHECPHLGRVLAEPALEHVEDRQQGLCPAPGLGLSTATEFPRAFATEFPSA